MHIVTQLASHFARRAKALVGGTFRKRAKSDDESMSDADLESMFDGHICAHLAALPRAYLDLVPPDLADLIRQAKEFHDVMDTRGAEQEAELAETEVGFRPRHHVRLRVGPHADKYLAVPAAVRCEYAAKDIEARVERVQIRRAGGIVIDVFGNKVPSESRMANDGLAHH